MGLYFNDEEIAAPEKVYFNGTSVASVYFNGTKVWVECYTAGDTTTLKNNSSLADVTNEVNTQLDSYTVPKCGTYRVHYYYTAIWKGVRTDIRVNGATVHQHDHIDGDVTQKTTSGSYDTAQLTAGDVISIWQEPFHPWENSGSGNWQVKVA